MMHHLVQLQTQTTLRYLFRGAGLSLLYQVSCFIISNVLDTQYFTTTKREKNVTLTSFQKKRFSTAPRNEWTTDSFEVIPHLPHHFLC